METITLWTYILASNLEFTKNHFKQESKQMRVYNVGNLSKE